VPCALQAPGAAAEVGSRRSRNVKRRVLIVVTTVFADDHHLLPPLRAGATG
jgi:hypothetical protein